MRYASSGRGVTLETLTDGQMSGKSGTKTENGHISTATAEAETLEAWTPSRDGKGQPNNHYASPPWSSMPSASQSR